MMKTLLEGIYGEKKLTRKENDCFRLTIEKNEDDKRKKTVVLS